MFILLTIIIFLHYAHVNFCSSRFTTKCNKHVWFWGWPWPGYIVLWFILVVCSCASVLTHTLCVLELKVKCEHAYSSELCAAVPARVSPGACGNILLSWGPVDSSAIWYLRVYHTQMNCKNVIRSTLRKEQSHKSEGNTTYAYMFTYDGMYNEEMSLCA